VLQTGILLRDEFPDRLEHSRRGLFGACITQLGDLTGLDIPQKSDFDLWDDTVSDCGQ
jgi:hypothetical protein